MRVVVFDTTPQKIKGLIGKFPLPEDTVFLFTDVRPGQVFHSRGVLEPFVIAFKDAQDRTLLTGTLTPPHATAVAPTGTTHVLEAKVGTLLTT